jgi:hypothetical protein
MMTASPLTDWPRQYHVPGGKDAFLFYVVHGDVDTTMSLSRSKYRSGGIPAREAFETVWTGSPAAVQP